MGRSNRWSPYVVVGLATISLARAQVPGFHPTGFASGTGGSRATGLSANGGVAAGFSITPNADPTPGFTWTASGGRVDFGLEAGLPIVTIGNAISGDGTAVVGQSRTGTVQRAFLYRGPGTYQEIAPSIGYSATAATGVGGDGSVVAGTFFVPQSLSSQAFRWTQVGGAQPLGFARPTDGISSAGGISRDGATIVGMSGDGSGYSVGFAWRLGTGMTALPELPNSLSSIARGVNFDGSIIVGQSGIFGTEPAVWRNGQVVNLGVPTGWANGTAFAVNDTGSTIVGYAGGNAGLQSAAIWTPDFGAELLSTFLARNGVSVPADWTLLRATAVSADGLTIAGWGRNSQTGSEGFVVTIPAPCPADLDNDGNLSNGGTCDFAVTIDDLLYFLTAFESGNLAADLDNGTGAGVHDGAVTVEDLLYFLAHFEAGC